jgi:hypothetical protein
LKTLRPLAEELDKKLYEFGQLTHELVKIYVGNAPTGLMTAFSKVQDRPEPWIKPRPAMTYRSQEEWTERPTVEQALAAWNRFLVALQKQPVKMYRISPKRDNEWEAEFQRVDGSRMFVSISDLTGDQRYPEIDGMYDASVVEIVDQIAAWLEKEEVAALKESVAT